MHIFSFSNYCSFPKWLYQNTFSPVMYESSVCTMSSSTLAIARCFVLLSLAILVCGEQKLTVLIICISLLNNHEEHTFMCLLVICIYSALIINFLYHNLVQFNSTFLLSLYLPCDRPSVKTKRNVIMNKMWYTHTQRKSFLCIDVERFLIYTMWEKGTEKCI